MDICFIPDGSHWQYIESRGIRLPEGEFVDDAGHVLGMHHGIHRYTVGMRRRLGIATGERMYVRAIDPATNRVILSPAHEPRESQVELTDMHWFLAPEQGRLYYARGVIHGVWGLRRWYRIRMGAAYCGCHRSAAYLRLGRARYFMMGKKSWAGGSLPVYLRKVYKMCLNLETIHDIF